MTEYMIKEALAHGLVRHATYLLRAAARLRGDEPSMHNNAEFQALDIMHKDMEKLVYKYRKNFQPYGVEQI